MSILANALVVTRSKDFFSKIFKTIQIDCDQTAMGLPPVTSAVFFLQSTVFFLQSAVFFLQSAIFYPTPLPVVF
jgi:hypothetical protein